MMTKHFLRILLALAVTAGACLAAAPKKPQPSYPSTGALEPLDPVFNQLIAPGTKVDKLADGFKWSEGPVWSVAERALLFSDIPANSVLKWQEGKGISVFLKPSGYTGSSQREGEQGANGLLIDSSGRLVLCQHGDRRVARLEKDKSFTTLAEYYLYRRLNSPNDAVLRSNGDIYFTDPPYGLEKGNQDIKKELLFSGVYRVDSKGEVHLLTSELACPNGIAFSPNEKTLYVANSDPEKPIWMAFDVQPDGGIANGRVLFDAKPLTKDKKGMPDGLKVDKKGNLFASGPGGVLVLSPSGKHLGTIGTGDLVSNCAWGDEGGTLYMTSNGSLCRIKTLTRGNGF
jgi:gluconolactonase